MTEDDPRELFTLDETRTTEGGDIRKPDLKKLRASLFNFVKDYSNIVSDESKEPDMEAVTKRWYNHLKNKHGGAWVIFVNNNLDNGVPDLVDITEELYEKHDPFREVVDGKWVYNEDAGNSNGSGQREESDDSTPSAKYTDIGVKKLRGYLLQFIKDKSSIKSTSEEVNFEVLAEEFDKWATVREMKEKGFTNISLKKITESTGGDLSFVEETAKGLYEADGFDKFRELVDDKWDSSTGKGSTSGISDYADVHGVDDGDDDEEEINEPDPSGIDIWAEEHGTADEWESPYNKDIEVNRIIQGDSKEVMLNELPRNCVDMIITSPPYWAVRDYEGDIDAQWDDGEWVGQLGHEPTPDLFVEHLMEVFRACRRVLKPTGSLWINIDDTYGGKPGGHYDNDDYEGGSLGSQGDRPSLDIGGTVPQKCQAGVPERLVISMLDGGWIKRNTVHWSKQVLFEDDDVRGATKPSAVKDRFVEKAQEYLFFFVQQQDYYFDLDKVRRPHKTKPTKGQHYTEDAKMVQDEAKEGGSDLSRNYDDSSFYSEGGGNLPVNWQVNPARSTDDHYAPWPERLVERPILAACPEDGIVLDPFAGTGTTGRVAMNNNRNFIGIELSEKYVKIARRNLPTGKQVTIL